MKTTLRVAALLVMSFSLASVAFAQNAVLEARQSLTTYDLRGTATTDVLRALGTYVATPANGEPQRREARFLRALAGSDLYLIARLTDDRGLLERLAAGLGVPVAEIPIHLDAELRELLVGFYADAANEARALLRLTDADPAAFDAIRGIRRDYLYLRAVARRLGPGADAFPVLEALGADPCAGACQGQLATLDPASRKVFAALQRVHQAAANVARAKRERDPFANAVSDLDALVARVSSLPLGLRYVVDASASLTPLLPVTAASTTAPDAITFVSAEEIRVAFLPRVVVSSAGVVGLDARSPTYPGGTRVPLPASFPRDVAAIEALVAPLRARFSGARVALAGAQMVPSHIVARIALTLRAAGAEVVAITGRTPVGALAFFPITWGTAPGSPPLIVGVRSAGYEILVGRARTNVPAVREGRGHRSDTEGLARRLSAETAATAEVRFAREVPFGWVVHAVAQTRATRPPTLLLAP